MKLVVVVISLLSICGVTEGAENSKSRTITVFGAAETFIIPDRVEWSLTIRAREESAERAAAAADKVLKDSITTLESLGLSPKDIKAGSAAMTRQFVSKDGMQTRKVAFYETTQVLKFTEQDVSKFELFRRSFMDVEGLEVRPTLISTAADSVRSSMRIAALRSAKVKAEELAAVVGATVGNAISISEFKPEATSRDIELAYQSGMVFFPNPEEIRFEARIYVVFELEYGPVN